MNYDDFMKSKHIAERWGEFQEKFKNMDKSSELKAYHELLTEFYEYIQYLETHFFAADKTSVDKNLLTDWSVNSQASTASAQIPMTLSPSQEHLTGEEDPWFGVNDE